MSDVIDVGRVGNGLSGATAYPQRPEWLEVILVNDRGLIGTWCDLSHDRAVPVALRFPRKFEKGAMSDMDEQLYFAWKKAMSFKLL